MNSYKSIADMPYEKALKKIYKDVHGHYECIPDSVKKVIMAAYIKENIKFYEVSNIVDDKIFHEMVKDLVCDHLTRKVKFNQLSDFLEHAEHLFALSIEKHIKLDYDNITYRKENRSDNNYR